jgi:hypothetical protein
MLLGKLVASYGMGPASLISTAVRQAIWLGGVAMLFIAMSGTLREATLPLLGVVCLSATYGGFGVFNYGEGFVMPRIYTEGLALWGLWALARGRLILAGGLMLAGLVLHPIMALTGMAMAIVYLAQGDRRWCYAIVASLAAICALALAGVSPFDRLGQTIDPVRLDLIQQRNIYLFPTMWEPVIWYRTVCMAVFTAVAAFVLTVGSAE